MMAPGSAASTSSRGRPSRLPPSAGAGRVAAAPGAAARGSAGEAVALRPLTTTAVCGAGGGSAAGTRDGSGGSMTGGGGNGMVRASVGRELELNTMAGLLDRAMSGCGSVVGVVAPPGIGKSRLVRDVMEIARSRGVYLNSHYCESHAAQIPFRAMARLFRAAWMEGLGEAAVRALIRARTPTPRTCCCSMTYWTSPTLTWNSLGSIRTPGDDG